MSRSEHGNARDKHDPRDRARKRRIKTLIVSERMRHRSTPTVVSTAIPIDVIDRGSHVHYPASIDDLRGVMERLPSGSLNGLGGIELCLTPLDPGREPDATLDPFVGRLGTEIVAGVYAPDVLGRYRANGARIELFAYVYDPETPERSILEMYLRLAMLATLVHELAERRPS